MGLLSDPVNCGLRMGREFRKSFPCHRRQRKPLISDPGMHHGTCVYARAWCMSGSLTRGGGENVPGIPVALATHNFTYLALGPPANRQLQDIHYNTLDRCHWSEIWTIQNAAVYHENAMFFHCYVPECLFHLIPNTDVNEVIGDNPNPNWYT